MLAVTLDRRDIPGRRHVFDDGVEHGLHALVLERRAARHQTDLVLQRAGTQSPLDLHVGEFTAFEILVQQLFIALGGGFNHLRAPYLAFLEHVGRNVAIFELHTLCFFVPENGLHFHEVDHAGEAVLRSNGKLNGNRVTT